MSLLALLACAVRVAAGPSWVRPLALTAEAVVILTGLVNVITGFVQGIGAIAAFPAGGRGLARRTPVTFPRRRIPPSGSCPGDPVEWNVFPGSHSPGNVGARGHV